MIALPLSLISGLILGFLFVRMVVQQGRMTWLAVLSGAVAAQAVIVALALHYGVAPARWMQPVMAMALPPLVWLGWKAGALGAPLRLRDAWHLLGPLSAIALRLSDSLLLEALVPLAYLVYAAALARGLHGTGDLPRGRLSEGTALLRRVWGSIAAALVLSAASDLLLMAAILSGHAEFVPLIVDLFTAALLLGLGLLALGASRLSAGPSKTPMPVACADDTDHALFARLEEHMRARQAWRDPDLTLAQLARRLGVPAKRLSVAVNLVTGESISRYVNGLRVEAACAALADGASVTDAMLEAGFITKSNFNREFRRVTCQTPTEWRAERAV